MPRRGPTARLYSEIDGNSPSTQSVVAQQAEANLARISRVLNLDNLPELEQFLRENDLVLQVSYRCRCRNNRGWRCNNATDKRGTQCKSCGDARREREKLQWAQRMVRDSRAKDDKRKCSQCGVGDIPEATRKSKLMDWCLACRKRRQLLQMADFRKQYGAYKTKEAERRMIANSQHKDRSKGKVSQGPNYIDVPYLEGLREKQDTKCYWCGIEMDPVNRKRKCGMTVDCLDNGPHLKNHCVLGCFSCNAKSYLPAWNPWPQRLTKILKLPVNEKNYFIDFNPSKRSSQWPSRLTINQWQRCQEELLQRPLIA